MATKTHCINTETSDVSDWDRFFVRIWRVKGSYYGVDDTGIFKFVDPADDPNPPTCSITTAPNDLGTEALKRLPYARVETLGSADITLTLDTEFAGTASMAAIDNRAKFARGPRGRFVSFALTSTAPEFALLEIEPTVQPLTRGFK